MRLALAGVSHHRAPLELRERVAVDLTAAGALAHELSSGARGGHETVVLSTCNRTELYLAADHDEGLAELANRLGGPLLDGLRERVGSHETVQEVRGRGLMVAVELDSGPRA